MSAFGTRPNDSDSGVQPQSQNAEDEGAREILRAKINEVSVYDDCSSIEMIEYEWEGERVRLSPEKVHDKIRRGEEFRVTYQNESYTVKAAKTGVSKYVRCFDKDSHEDPLVKIAQSSDWTSRGGRANRRNTEEEPSSDDTSYTQIAETIVDTMTDKSSNSISRFRNRKKFFKTVSKKFKDVDGARVRGQEIVVDEVESEVFDEDELVFHVFYEAIESHLERAEEPMHKLLRELEDAFEDVEGSQNFLDIAVVKPAEKTQKAKGGV